MRLSTEGSRKLAPKDGHKRIQPLQFGRAYMYNFSLGERIPNYKHPT